MAANSFVIRPKSTKIHAGIGSAKKENHNSILMHVTLTERFFITFWVTRRVYQSLLASTPRNNFTLSLNKLRVLNHQNLARVMGACLEDDLKAIVVEHCTKGSLQVNPVKVSTGSGE